MHQYRTHTCESLSVNDINKQVRLSGWIHRKRDHGGLMFIDLRDHYGITQCVINRELPIFKEAEKARVESVITITGKVVKRSDETINKNIKTGEIEVSAEELVIESMAQVLPFQVADDDGAPEEMRLRYRFLDLRREKLHKNIILRSKVISFIRNHMTSNGFLEMQTPILTASSPEGARDFLVPSRLHHGKFYALPQAPQQFKQLLMTSGYDRYFQIAPCFRDEDARADRSPGEFYQLDLEMAYVTQEDIFAVVEKVMHDTFKEFSNGKTVTSLPFPRIPYAESMLKYGVDKPDLRNPIEMCEVADIFKGSDFSLFAGLVDKGYFVRAIPAPTGAKQARSFFDKLNDWAKAEGFGGLGYIIFENGEVKGPIGSKLDAKRLDEIKTRAKLKDGDAVFFVSGNTQAALKFAGTARDRIGKELDICEKDVYKFCWVVDFPMYEYDEKLKKIDFSHNPFSMPQGGMEALTTKDPLDILAYQYDIVCNGIELSSGAVRNHKPEVMFKAFEIAGYTQEDVERIFGGMLRAFQFGAPPHGGSAPGIDRIIMLLSDSENIREIIAFPLNQQGEDLLMGAPSVVKPEQLRDLAIKIDLPPVKK